MDDEETDIRWRQRFDQFQKAYNVLQVAIALPHPSVVERAGLIQLFEMAFELSWNLIKDYLEADGYQVKGPRDVLKNAFQAGLIAQGHIWIDALEDRNLTVHTYNESVAIAVEEKIRYVYYPLLQQLYCDFELKCKR